MTEKIEIKIDAEQVTLDDLIMVEELTSGQIPARQLKGFVARFMVNNGQYLPEQQALAAAGKLTMAELKQAFEAMSAKIKELQATAVPPATSSG